MERLTVNNLNKVCYDPWELCGMDSYCKKGCHEEGGCTKGCHILKMYRKLAEYEDLEEQGKLPKLPCAVGDVVYQSNKFLHRVCEHVINEVKIDFDGIWAIDTSDNVYSPDDFGKMVFLTQEKADAALKKMEESK